MTWTFFSLVLMAHPSCSLSPQQSRIRADQSKGYLDGRVGAGTYVNTRLPEDFLAAPQPAMGSAEGTRKAPRLSQYARRLIPAPPAGVPPPRPFRPEPALDQFPLDVWTQIAGRCMRRATRSLLADSDSRGYRPLREAVADYLGSE
jgi:GntR family transcriptional regulator/MocR family aminotransferase